MGEFGQLRQNSVNFTGISEPQDSVKGMTNILDIFAQFSDKDVVQEILYVTCHCTHSNLKILRAVFFSSSS